MAAKGSILKQEIAEKILEAFPGSFLYNNGKEIRINGMEDGSPLQIKCVLTASKTPVSAGEDTVLPGEQIQTTQASAVQAATPQEAEVPQEPTDEEKQRLVELLDKLGL